MPSSSPPDPLATPGGGQHMRWMTGASQETPPPTTLGAPRERGCPLQPQKHGRSYRTSSTLQHHSLGGGPGDCDLQLQAVTGGFLRLDENPTCCHFGCTGCDSQLTCQHPCLDCQHLQFFLHRQRGFVLLERDTVAESS
jgi:hypothetical protein